MFFTNNNAVLRDVSDDRVWDFPVEKREAFYLEPVTHRMVAMPDNAAIVRADTGDTLAVMSNKYTIVQHGDVVNNARNAFRHLGLDVIEDFRTTQNGSRLHAEFRVPDVKIDIGTKGRTDLVELRTVIGNSHDGSKAKSIDLGGYRLICTNGMMIGKSLFRAKRKHIGAVNVSEVANQLQRAICTYTDKVAPYWQELTQIEVPMVRIEEELDKAVEANGGMTRKFAKQILERVEHYEDRDYRDTASLWDVMNGITWVTTHEVAPRRFARAKQLEDVGNGFLKDLHQQYAIAA